MPARSEGRRWSACASSARFEWPERTRDLAAEAIEGIHLAHECTLAHATEGRVAGHLADGVESLCEEERPGARPG